MLANLKHSFKLLTHKHLSVMENFTQILKNFFAGQGMTQQDVADKLHVSRTIVTNHLNGQRTFGSNVAMKWAKVFGLDPLWLITSGEQGTPPNQHHSIVATAISTAKDESDVINVPVLNLDVRGGLLPNAVTDTPEYKVATMPFSRTIATEQDIVVPVYGDSMTPRYPSGSHILIRPLPMWPSS